MTLRPYLRGALTYIPILEKNLTKLGVFLNQTGGTNSARYSYSVWLRHLTMAFEHHLLNPFPQVIAELGPGDSLGIGLAGLLSGANRYYAFDVVEYASNQRNMDIFDKLVDLFHARADMPGAEEFPDLQPTMDSYKFPSHVLSEAHLEKALKPERISSIRSALANLGKKGEASGCIFYAAPWDDQTVLTQSSVDMIYSQAVLEHVDALDRTYGTMWNWLKPRGFMSHTVDFGCHKLTRLWSGHWTYSDLSWKIIRGRRPWLLNREPYSTHVELMKKHNFRIVCEKRVEDTAGIKRNHLARRFRQMSDQCLTTRNAYFLAVKK